MLDVFLKIAYSKGFVSMVLTSLDVLLNAACLKNVIFSLSNFAIVISEMWILQGTILEDHQYREGCIRNLKVVFPKKDTDSTDGKKPVSMFVVGVG